jgi:hypothetical protein
MLIKAKSLKGYKLVGTDGVLGKVKEFFFDDQHWTVRYLVADTGNWLTGRQVLLSPYSIVAINSDTEQVGISLSKMQIENSPPLNSDKPVSRQYESSYYGYYGYPAYWNGSLMWGVYPYITRNPEDWKKPPETESSADPHLRSTDDVSGHNIQATDGEIGHVEDFIIDEENWAIRYLVVDTKNWWAGKLVLVSPLWIDRVSWSELKVFVNLSRDSIKRSPEYSDEMLITREYELMLHRNYDRTGYWADEPAEKRHSY